MQSLRINWKDLDSDDQFEKNIINAYKQMKDLPTSKKNKNKVNIEEYLNIDQEYKLKSEDGEELKKNKGALIEQLKDYENKIADKV